MKKFIPYKLILHNCKDKNDLNKGFTLIEAISTLLMGSIILGAAFSGFFQIKEFFSKDTLNADVNQRLRTALMSMGPDLQQLGEGINNRDLPTITLSRNNNISEVTIRRGGLDALTLCADIEKDTTDAVTVLDTSFDTSPACISVNDSNGDGWPDTVKNWANLRNGNTVKAFIIDTATNDSEFFEYNGEETLDEDGISMTPSSGSEPDVVKLTTNNHTWANDYSAATTAIFLFNESTYKVSEDNRLQLIRNGEVFDLVEDIEEFHLTAVLQENTSATPSRCKTISLTGVSDCTPTFSGTYTWNQIRSIEVQIVALPPKGKEEVLTEDQRTLTQQFLPRNRLSF